MDPEKTEISLSGKQEDGGSPDRCGYPVTAGESRRIADNEGYLPRKTKSDRSPDGRGYP